MEYCASKNVFLTMLEMLRGSRAWWSRAESFSSRWLQRRIVCSSKAGRPQAKRADRDRRGLHSPQRSP